MIVTWLGHAGLFINAAGKTVLVDPFFGPHPTLSWVRETPPPFTSASMLPPPDVVLLTGADESRSASTSLSRVRARGAVYALDATLEPRVHEAGFQRFTTLHAERTDSLAAGLTVTPFGTSRACSFALQADGVTLWLECAEGHPVERQRDWQRRLGTIDLACLSTAPEPEVVHARFIESLGALHPAEAFAYGADVRAAPLDPRHHGHLRGLMAQALPEAHRLGTHLLHLQPGDEWSPETGVIPRRQER